MSICDNRIMIVEDDIDVRETLVEVLEDHHYVPLAVSNGQEAVDRLRSDPEKPCVILLDVMMPVMDGMQFRAIQRKDPELESIPVVVLTAHANMVDLAEQMNASAFLRKPVALDALLEIVQRFCRKLAAVGDATSPSGLKAAT